MPDISSVLINADVRNQVLLERLKEGEHKKFTPFLKSIEKDLRARLLLEGETISSIKRLRVLLADVTNLQKAIYDDYNGQLSIDLGEIGVSQSEFEAESYTKAVSTYLPVTPTSDQVLTAVRVNPMQLQAYSGRQLIQPFIADWSKNQIQLVKNAIQQGFYQGQSTAEIIRRIRGTKGNNFNDGELAKVNRANRTVVRTAVQHMSTQARQLTMSRNDDLIKGYQWVSVLDSRTSNQCSALDGRIFDVGDGPLPPIHPNCRSATTPVLSDEFDFDKSPSKVVDETYYSWLKKQPLSFQSEAIGATRAKLLRDGGLSSEEFAKLSLNKNFESMTLSEMRKKAPTVFEEANI